MKATLPYTTEVLITELHDRGVGISDIFAQYYAMEAAEDAHSDELFGNDEQGQHGKPLTVADAELALDIKPNPKPF